MMIRVLGLLLCAIVAFAQPPMLLLGAGGASAGGGGGIAIKGTPACATSSNGNSVTLTGYDGTGANFIALAISDFGNSPVNTDISSSPSEPSWTCIGALNTSMNLCYAKNVSNGTTGMSFTFTHSGSFPAICALAASNVNTTTPQDGTQQATATPGLGGSTCNGSPCTAGSISPAGTDLFIFMSNGDNGTMASYALGSTFNYVKQAANPSNGYSNFLGYKLSSSSENPQLTNSGNPDVSLNAFKQ